MPLLQPRLGQRGEQHRRFEAVQRGALKDEGRRLTAGAHLGARQRQHAAQRRLLLLGESETGGGSAAQRAGDAREQRGHSRRGDAVQRRHASDKPAGSRAVVAEGG